MESSAKYYDYTVLSYSNFYKVNLCYSISVDTVLHKWAWSKVYCRFFSWYSRPWKDQVSTVNVLANDPFIEEFIWISTTRELLQISEH